MNILLLSAGGGGGNILRSVKALFRQDLAIAEQADPKYADRLRRAVSTRFLDTNEFSLLNVLPEERVLIGASTTRRFGARHSINCLRFILFEQNFVTGIGCLNALPSQKMSFGSMPLLTM